MPWSHASNVHVYFGENRLPSWADCVGLSFEHTGPETQDERRTILLVLVRATGGGYEVVTEDGSRTMPTAEATKGYLIQFVADSGCGTSAGTVRETWPGEVLAQVLIDPMGNRDC